VAQLSTLGIMSKKRLFISALVSVVLAMPMVGFVFGIITTEGGESVPLFGRLWVGALYTIMTPLSLGFPPTALEDNAQSYNLWPYIIVCGLVIFGIRTVFACRKNSPKHPT
jgi:hypothetical protein